MGDEPDQQYPDHLSQLIQVSRKGSEPDLSGDLDSVGMRQGTQERYGNWWSPYPLIRILSSSDRFFESMGACVSLNGLLLAFSSNPPGYFLATWWGQKPQEGAMVPSPTWQPSRRCQWKSEESEKRRT